MIFPRGHDCIQATNGLPETFGGLMLGAAEEAGHFSVGGGEQTEGSENTITAPVLPTAPPTVGEHLRAIDQALGYIRAKGIAIDGLSI